MSENDNLRKFKDELKKLFRTDDSSLDWGIYKITNQINKDITDYIEEKIPKICENKISNLVKKLSVLESEKLESKKKEIELACEKAGVNKKDNTKYKEILAKQKNSLSKIDLESQIYSLLIDFFSRYYQNGDIIPKFYFKEDTYLIPYNGEETSLYWPTKDMYYVKSSNDYKRFSFKIKDYNITFKITLTNEEKNNNKSELKGYLFVDELEFKDKNKELIVSFRKENLNQDDLIKKLEELLKIDIKKSKNIIDLKKEELLEYNTNKIKQKLEEKITNINVEEIKHSLIKFSRKSEEDFFIHKDLKNFLTKQLTFFINQEILNIGSILDVENIDYDKSKIIKSKVFKEVADEIIEKLSKVEDLKKKIWEKKKFVLETNYVITLDKILEYTNNDKQYLKDLFNNSILKNKDQIKEWKTLFDINIEKYEDILESKTSQKTLNSQGEEFSLNIKKLPLDTKYFSEDFKYSLLNKLSQNPNFNLDEDLNGNLFHSENWQALNLIQEKYKEKIQCCYIDPPFNLGDNGDFVYKTNYLYSSWSSLLLNRIILTKSLMNINASFFTRCDYHGNYIVRMIKDNIFGVNNFRNEIVVARTKTALYLNVLPENPRNLGNYFETIYWFSKNANIKFKSLSDGIITEKRESYWKDLKSFYKRPKNRYELFGILPKEGCSWVWKKEDVLRGVENYNEFLNKFEDDSFLERYWMENGENLKFIKKTDCTLKYWVEPKKKVSHNNWTALEGYSRKWNFLTENSERLLKRIVHIASKEKGLILDSFLGSGTTTAVAHKLNRNWLGVEMGSQFNGVILPRMKQVLFYDQSGISKDEVVKKNYNKDKAGGFFKYHKLEQYEDSLENVVFDQQKIDDIKNSSERLKYYLTEGYKDNNKTFLGVNTERHFLNFKIKVLQKDGTTKDKTVDLIETFNYLIGLWVNKYIIKENKKDNNRKYYFIDGVVDEKSILVVWRDPKGLDTEEKRKLDKQFIKEIYSNNRYVYLYTNTDCNITCAKNIYDEMRKRLYE